jgi:CubicO group peptidase (beta-lactamase class C family)
MQSHALTRRRRTYPAFVTPFVITLLAAAAAPARCLAQSLTPAAPETVGLSSERLERLHQTMKAYTDEGRIAGVVTLIARNGHIAEFQAFGALDREKQTPMQKDAIFRIASQSKAVTSVAVLMLLEEGKLLLSDPVSKYIPSFKNSTVAVPPAAGAPADAPIGILPAKREITLRDLLTHTAGISYGGGPAATQWKAAGLDTFYCADKNETIGALVERMGKLPMDAQPGEKFIYGYNTDILGAVVEKISGLPLDEFFRTRIFEPLKMTDTSFYLPPDKRARLATVYALKDGATAVERAPDPGLGQGDYVDGPRKCFAGGAGLLSTATDYARFLQMLLNGGELDGVRLLSPKTIELATSNNVGRLFNEGKTGFGLGFEVVEHLGDAGRPGSVGEFGWGGAYYTSYWVDPKEKMVVVFMSQLLPAGGLDLQGKFRSLVYQSIVGPPTGIATATPTRRSR